MYVYIYIYIYIYLTHLADLRLLVDCREFVSAVKAPASSRVGDAEEVLRVVHAVLAADTALLLLRMLTCAHVCSRMLTYAHVCSRVLTYADVC